MNSIWNNNIAAFKTRFPGLAQAFSKILSALDISPKDFPFWEVKPAKDGKLTATENNLLLHSAYSPLREAQNLLKNPGLTEKGTTVFYGFGLGYQVIEWAKDTKLWEKQLILVEPDPLHFFAALWYTDWTPVFKVPKLIVALACPLDQIISLIEPSDRINPGDKGVSDCFFVENPSFIAHQKEYFSALKDLVQRNLQKNEINAATLKKFGKLWVKNSLKNLDYLTKSQTIQKYKDKGKDLPFLILGAGPSLQTVLPYLKELKERAVIVCVETALHILLKTGIEPDFILLTDPQYWAWRHIAGLKAPSSVLITELSAYPPVFNFNCKAVELCASQFPLGHYFEKQLDINAGDLGTGGSVASCCWNFAYFCGASSIFTAGLDLSYPKGETHIKGSQAEQTIHTKAYRLNSAEKCTVTAVFSANAGTRQNYLGEMVRTDSRMEMFAWWFESRLAACPSVRTATLCPQSLKIPGIDYMPVQKILELPLISRPKEAFLKLTEKPSCGPQKLKKLQQEFPDAAFLQEYDFLKPYLSTAK